MAHKYKVGDEVWTTYFDFGDVDDINDLTARKVCAVVYHAGGARQQSVSIEIQVAPGTLQRPRKTYRWNCPVRYLAPYMPTIREQISRDLLHEFQ